MPTSVQLTIIISPDWKGRTIASFLLNQMRFSRRILRSLKKEGGIQINGEVVPAWHQLNGGEQLKLYLPLVEQNINLEPIPLAIVYEDHDLVVVKLYTGRTHQIRVHLSDLGHPLLGDSLYGAPDPKLTRTALHAVSLSFHHPRLEKKIKVHAELPVDLRMLAARLGIM